MSMTILEDQLSDLRKKRASISVKRSVWMKKGKDVSSLDAELENIKNQIRTITKGGPSTNSIPATPSAKSTGGSADYKQGYQDAIDAIKKALEGKGTNKQGKGAEQSDNNPGLQQPPVPGQQNQPGQNGKSDKQDKDGQSGDGQSGNDSQSSGRGNGNTGTVHAEDMARSKTGAEGPGGYPGKYIDRKDGDKIAKSEGYKDNGKSEDAQAKEFEEKAIKEASKLQGGGPGGLRSRIESMYKTNTDWKAALRKVVGRSINPAATRQAFANKNVLTSQDRIARTEKDKYDNLDYIVAAIDTSGSISDNMLKLMLSEVYQVALKKKPMKIDIVYCDCQCGEIVEFKSASELKNYILRPNKKINGGGGTEFQPLWGIFQNGARDPHISEKAKTIVKDWPRKTTELLMLFTDGYCDQYKRDPRHMSNLCWVILDNPSFDLKFKEPNTYCVHINSHDVK